MSRLGANCGRRPEVLAVPLLVAAIGLTSCAGPREAAPQPETPPEAGPMEDAFLVTGYHPWWLQGAWREYDRSVFDEIYFFSVDVDSTGSIAERNGWPDRWFSMQRELSDAGIRVTPVVTLFSQRAFERLFTDADGAGRLMESLLDLLRDSPAAGGLHLDFEVYQPVAAVVRSNFTDFVRRLRAEMVQIRSDLSLSLYLLAYDQSDVFDEARLAEVADYVVVQGYDLHGRSEDHTGPVAPLEGWGDRNWQFVVERLRGLGVPASKIVVSVPFYGYEWPAESEEPGARTRGAGKTISYAPVDSAYTSEGPPVALERAAEYGLRRDPESGSPYYAFQDSTGWRQGWFEDAESLRRKYSWVVEEGLRGVAVYPPAYGTDELDALLREAFNPTGL